jgi:hypothetical protein
MRWLKRLLRPRRSLLDLFMERFPGSCPICSYHRYGISHGFLKHTEPLPEHECLTPVSEAS